jgi:hypothetical protein
MAEVEEEGGAEEEEEGSEEEGSEEGSEDEGEEGSEEDDEEEGGSEDGEEEGSEEEPGRAAADVDSDDEPAGTALASPPPHPSYPSFIPPSFVLCRAMQVLQGNAPPPPPPLSCAPDCMPLTENPRPPALVPGTACAGLRPTLMDLYLGAGVENRAWGGLRLVKRRRPANPPPAPPATP